VRYRPAGWVVSRGRPASAKQSSGLQVLLGLVAVCVVVRWHVLGTLGLLVAYGLVCWWWPVVDCGKCQGTGKLYAPFGRTHRTCSRCHGERVHVRLGRQLVDWANH
jgi:hypothetical protein